MRTGRARTPMTIATALLLASTAVACGSDAPPPRTPTPDRFASAHPDTRPSAAGLLSSVIANIDAKGSAHDTVRGNLGMVGELNAQGVLRYHGNLNDPAVRDADLALTGRTRMAQDQPPQPVDLVVMNDTGYLKSPLLQPEPGKPWLKVEPGDSSFASRLLGPGLDQLRDSADPRRTFSGVEAATKIQSSGSEVLDGHPTTHYELRVLTNPAARTSHAPEQREKLAEAARSGTPELGYQLWVDQAGLPVRFAATQDVNHAGQVSLTSTYRDWGVPADIQAPADDRIGDFREAPALAQPPR